MSRGKNKDYAKANRDRYQKGFKQAYGMEHKEWAKWKKDHTKAEVQARRDRARVIREKTY